MCHKKFISIPESFCTMVLFTVTFLFSSDFFGNSFFGDEAGLINFSTSLTQER